MIGDLFTGKQLLAKNTIIHFVTIFERIYRFDVGTCRENISIHWHISQTTYPFIKENMSALN